MALLIDMTTCFEVLIIGGGFSGTSVASHLINSADFSGNIAVINDRHRMARGIAYDPHSDNLLLNVPNQSMSAFDNQPENYVEWLSRKRSVPKCLLPTFSTRKEYGEYLSEIWDDTVRRFDSKKKIVEINDWVYDITEEYGYLVAHLSSGQNLRAFYVILATGLDKPSVSSELDNIDDKHYFADAWSRDCLDPLPEKDVLIMGAGLTAIDIILGLKSRKFKYKIHTLSPNGYNLKQWEYEKPAYPTAKFLEEFINQDNNLSDLLQIFNKHRKIADKLEQSVFSILDSVRPHTSKIWCRLSTAEKQQFISRLKFYWDKARHRLPGELGNIIDQMKKDGQLINHRGRLSSISKTKAGILIKYQRKDNIESFAVNRVINCMSPESNIRRQKNRLLANLEKRGLVVSGPCGIGIAVNPTNLRLKQPNEYDSSNIFAIGSNLKGTLWESTSVPELRRQAVTITDQFKSMCFSPQQQFLSNLSEDNTRGAILDVML